MPNNSTTLNVTHIMAAVALAAVLITSQSAAVFASGQNGTTLTATKSATGFYETTRTYDWTLDKTVDPTSITIDTGETKDVTYTLTATRTMTSEVTEYGARGEICVTNGGEVATEGLNILDVVQTKIGSGQFQDYTSNNVDLGDYSVLAPGETHCYAYDFAFTPVDGATYKNKAVITITNHSGSLGTPKGPEPKADFSLPTEATIILVDEAATLTETEPTVEGFTHVDSATGPWSFSDSDFISFTKSITDVSAACDSQFSFVNTAALTETDTSEERTASATLTISTASCPVPPEEEPAPAPHTMGYWKTKPHEVHTTSLLAQTLGNYNVDVYAKAVGVFDAASAKNAHNMLAGQLLATKLSLANGSDSCAVVNSAIASADAILTAASYNGPNTTTAPSGAAKTIVTNLIGILDNYNNNGCA